MPWIPGDILFQISFSINVLLITSHLKLQPQSLTFIPIERSTLKGTMACIGKPEHLKRLGELLQEQQEPFLLEVFLLERGYSKKDMNLKGRCAKNSSKNSKGSASSGWLKRKKRMPPCSKVLKSIVNKLVSVEEEQKMPLNYNRAFEDRRFGVCQTSGRTHSTGELDRLSSASSMQVLDSTSESPSPLQNLHSCSSVRTSQALKLRNFREQQTITDGEHQCRYMEDSKNSPVSVLELPLDEAVFCTRANKKEIPSTSNFKLPKKVTQDSIFSVALRELLRHSLAGRREAIGVAKPQEVVNASPQHLKTRTLEQTKQFLFDCMREAVDSNGMNRKGKKQQKKLHELIEAKKVGKFICESICLWGKQSGNLTNITQLINSDFWNARYEWRDVRPQMKEIGLQIDEAIWEDMRNEIVIDMLTVLQ